MTDIDEAGQEAFSRVPDDSGFSASGRIDDGSGPTLKWDLWHDEMLEPQYQEFPRLIELDDFMSKPLDHEFPLAAEPGDHMLAMPRPSHSPERFDLWIPSDSPSES
jgi:hypothetical protein